MKPLSLASLLLVLVSLLGCEADGPSAENLRSYLTEIADHIQRSAEASGCPIIVEATERPPFSATFTVQNRGSDPLSIEKDFLPWRSGGNVVEFFVIGANGEPVRLSWPIADAFDFSEPHLGPGKSLSGTLDLRQRVLGLESALSKSPVLVLWVYSPHPARPGCVFSGVLELRNG